MPARLPPCKSEVSTQSTYLGELVTVQPPRLRAVVGAIGCKSGTPTRERREIRGNGPAPTRVSLGNIHTYCGEAADFRVSSEF